MKQFWIDFAEGRITVPEMLERTTAEPALLDKDGKPVVTPVK
jgi:hypothetical protein